MKLAFPRVKDWRSRWCHSAGSGTLHRVRSIEDRRRWNDYPSGYGETVCGRRGLVSMPGMLSRMYGPRCVKCCKALGIARGKGVPYNDATLSPPEGKKRDTTSVQPAGAK